MKEAIPQSKYALILLPILETSVSNSKFFLRAPLGVGVIGVVDVCRWQNTNKRNNNIRYYKCLFSLSSMSKGDGFVLISRSRGPSCGLPNGRALTETGSGREHDCFASPHFMFQLLSSSVFIKYLQERMYSQVLLRRCARSFSMTNILY